MVRFIRNLFNRETAPAIAQRPVVKTILGVQSLEGREAPAGIGHALSHIASSIAHQISNNNLNHQIAGFVNPSSIHNGNMVSLVSLTNFTVVGRR